MQIWYPGYEIRKDGDFAVTHNSNKGGRPFAVINLSEDGVTALVVQSAKEADRLIAAAVEAKRLLDPPVITDSGRDCDQANPVSGAWCHRDGDHGVHRDTDGEEWRTDLPGGVLLPGDCDPDNGDDAPGTSLVGRIVTDAHDDSPCPVTGKVVGQFDEETVEVLWGERQFAEYPGPGMHEPIDALRPATS